MMYNDVLDSYAYYLVAHNNLVNTGQNIVVSENTQGL